MKQLQALFWLLPKGLRQIGECISVNFYLNICLNYISFRTIYLGQLYPQRILNGYATHGDVPVHRRQDARETCVDALLLEFRNDEGAVVE